MCTVVRNLQTNQEAETPAELRQMLGVSELVMSGNSILIEDCCLCYVDVEATCKAAGWKYSEVNRDPMNVVVTPPSEKGRAE